MTMQKNSRNFTGRRNSECAALLLRVANDFDPIDSIRNDYKTGCDAAVRLQAYVMAMTGRITVLGWLEKDKPERETVREMLLACAECCMDGERMTVLMEDAAKGMSRV